MENLETVKQIPYQSRSYNVSESKRLQKVYWTSFVIRMRNLEYHEEN